MKKKYFVPLLTIFSIIITMIFLLKNNDNEIEYNLGEFQVVQKNNNGYSIKIKNNYVEYDLDINNKFSSKKIVKDIELYRDDITTCILPIYDDDIILNDFICEYDNKKYFYYQIKGKNQSLDDYISSLKIKNYDVENFVDKENYVKNDNNYIYYDNLTNDYVAITSYKGLIVINKKYKDFIKKINIFDKDVYNLKIKGFIDNNYFVADYNNEYDFNYVYVVDFLTDKITKIRSKRKISFDSIILGINDKSIYLLDKDEKKEYEIYKLGIDLVGTLQNGYKYYDKNTETKVDYNYLISNQKFENHTDYEQELIDNQYNIYKNNIYLFTTDNADSVININNSYYFQNDNCIFSFRFNQGKRKIYCNNELLFNENIAFGIYEKAN